MKSSTAFIRSLLRSHGVQPYHIFANKYRTCRTVKMYAHGGIDSAMESNIVIDLQSVVDGGRIPGMTFKVHPGAIIVRIPLTSQTVQV